MNQLRLNPEQHENRMKQIVHDVQNKYTLKEISKQCIYRVNGWMLEQNENHNDALFWAEEIGKNYEWIKKTLKALCTATKDIEFNHDQNKKIKIGVLRKKLIDKRIELIKSCDINEQTKARSQAMKIQHIMSKLSCITTNFIKILDHCGIREDDNNMNGVDNNNQQNDEKKEEKEEKQEIEDMCTICYFGKEEYWELGCGHIICTECFDNYEKSDTFGNKCMICRGQIQFKNKIQREQFWQTIIELDPEKELNESQKVAIKDQLRILKQIEIDQKIKRQINNVRRNNNSPIDRKRKKHRRRNRPRSKRYTNNNNNVHEEMQSHINNEEEEEVEVNNNNVIDPNEINDGNRANQIRSAMHNNTEEVQEPQMDNNIHHNSSENNNDDRAEQIAIAMQYADYDLEEQNMLNIMAESGNNNQDIERSEFADGRQVVRFDISEETPPPTTISIANIRSYASNHAQRFNNNHRNGNHQIINTQIFVRTNSINIYNASSTGFNNNINNDSMQINRINSSYTDNIVMPTERKTDNNQIFDNNQRFDNNQQNKPNSNQPWRNARSDVNNVQEVCPDTEYYGNISYNHRGNIIYPSIGIHPRRNMSMEGIEDVQQWTVYDAKSPDEVKLGHAPMTWDDTRPPFTIFDKFNFFTTIVNWRGKVIGREEYKAFLFIGRRAFQIRNKHNNQVIGIDWEWFPHRWHLVDPRWINRGKRLLLEKKGGYGSINQKHYGGALVKDVLYGQK